MGRLFFHVVVPLLATIFALIPVASLRADEFPFPVYAAEHGTIVRGGPSEAYYATQELKRGEELMVYRSEGEEWYAVRPPRGSYSLVSASAVAEQGDGNGEVVRNGAAARVGSSVSDLQDTVHVRLEQGEQVRILGSQTRDGVKWLRIEPPHGEFRWVLRNDVVTTPLEPASPIMLDELETTSEVLPLTHNGEDRYSVPPLAGESTPGASATPSANQQEIVQPEPLQGAVAPVPLPQTAPLAAGSGVPLTTNEAFARQLFVLEVELGRMVAESPNLWSLGGLEQDASQLLSRATTEAEREAVRQLGGRLQRFAEIRRRYGTLPSVEALLAARAPSAVPSTGLPSMGGLPSTIAQSVSDAAGASDSDSRFDAMGLLRPVASKRPDAPKYALVNDTGQIITFVTPAPDVNLQPYMGRRVGVRGARGYMAQYNHRHVTAGRVMPVGDSLLR